jgi:class 3 adenylate cyclase/tetratricopeptide (TPR) repeat protein
MRICEACGTSIAEGGSFCPSCGAPQRSARPDASSDEEWDRSSKASDRDARHVERRVTTVLFSDLVDFSGLAERLDAERLEVVQDRYFAAGRAAVERHGGVVEKYIGDAIMAVFGLPAVREDDPIRAIRAATDLHRAVGELGRELADVGREGLRVRTGINTGEVVASGHLDRAMVTGDAVNIAARLQQSAGPGEILVSGSTYRLVHHAVEAEVAGSLSVKGRVAPVEAYLVRALIADAETVARRLDGPFISRDAELGILSGALDEAIQRRTTRAVTIIGSPGVGKSRLVHEFLARARPRAEIVRGRCLPYGDGITWWPLVEIVHAAAGVGGADDPATIRARIAGLVEGLEHADLIERRIAAVVGVADEPAPSQEVAWAVRHLFEHLARRRPLVVVLDDIQWAEAPLLDLVEHVADRLVDVPVLFVFIARPELLDAHGEWRADRPDHRMIRLQALDERGTAELLAALLSGLDLSAVAQSRILEAADGNPLFLEQILAMLVDDGILQTGPEGWTVVRNLEAVTIPPTIGGLLAARLERLEESERATIERASVVGKVFWWGSVVDLTPKAERSEVGGYLATLVRREFIRPDPVGPDATVFPGDEAFRFRHLLVRDAAYARLSKVERADLHERFADWLESRTAVGPEYSGILGYHLEQAVRYRRELGREGERTDRLAVRAAAFLGLAGMAAWERGEARVAVNLLSRTVDLWPPDAPERREPMFGLAAALVADLRPDEGDARLAELAESLTRVPDEDWNLRIRLRQAIRAHFRSERGSVAHLERVAQEALDAWRRLASPALGAQALDVVGMLALQRGFPSEEDVALQAALELATLAGDRRRAQLIRIKRADRSGSGLRPIPDGIRICDEILADPNSGLELRATAEASLATNLAFDGRLNEAKQHLVASKRMADDLGAVMPLLAADWPASAASVERWLGDPAIAETYLREAVAIERDMHDHWHLSGMAPFLAEIIVIQGSRLDDVRRREARALIDESRAISASEDVLALAACEAVLARIQASEGRFSVAIETARRAVALTDPTEELLNRIEARLTLIDVATSAGRLELVAPLAREALDLARLKQSRLFEQIATEYLVGT